MPLLPDQESEYRRLAISYWDFDEAAGFASALSRLSERLGDTTAYAEALSQAFVVSYMRPFKYSLSGDNTDRILDVKSIQFTESQQRWHRLIEQLRDQAVAHSDPLPLQLSVEEYPDWGLVPSMREPRVPFTIDGAAELLLLAVSVRDQVTDRLAKFGTHVTFRG
jgi:hypothetical protein